MKHRVMAQESMYSLVESTSTSLEPSYNPTPAPGGPYYSNMSYNRNDLPTYHAANGSIVSSTSHITHQNDFPVYRPQRQTPQRFVHATDQQFVYIETDKDDLSISQVHKSSVPTAETTTFYSPTPAGATLNVSRTQTPSRHSTPQRLLHTRADTSTSGADFRPGASSNITHFSEQRAPTPVLYQPNFSRTTSNTPTRETLNRTPPFFQHSTSSRPIPPHRRLQTPPLPPDQLHSQCPSPSIPIFEHKPPLAEKPSPPQTPTPVVKAATMPPTLPPLSTKPQTPPPLSPTHQQMSPIESDKVASGVHWRNNGRSNQQQNLQDDLVPVYNPLRKQQYYENSVDPDLVTASLYSAPPTPSKGSTQLYDSLREKASARYRERLVHLFQKHAPHQLGLVDATLVSNLGREEQLLEALTRQYEENVASAVLITNHSPPVQLQPLPHSEKFDQPQQQAQQHVKENSVSQTQSVRGPAFWGVSVSDSPDLQVTSMYNDGPAWKAGIRMWDRLVSVGGQPINNFEDAKSAMLGSRVGEPVGVQVLRATDGALCHYHVVPQTILPEYKGSLHFFDTDKSHRLLHGPQAPLSQHSSLSAPQSMSYLPPSANTSGIDTELQELRKIYEQYAPHKVGHERIVLAQYPGREKEVVEMLRTKYESGYQSPRRGEAPTATAGKSSPAVPIVEGQVPRVDDRPSLVTTVTTSPAPPASPAAIDNQGPKADGRPPLATGSNPPRSKRLWCS